MKELDPKTVALFGTHLVEASAGCGKTHTITELYERLVTERALDTSQILVVTYTRAATAELRDRIRNRLRLAAEDPTRSDRDRPRLETALRSFDEAAVFTIHGFCQRVLADNAFESRVAFESELVPDLGPLLLEVVQDFWNRELHDAPAMFVHYLSDAHVRPESLLSLARKVTSDPELEVLPAEVSYDLAGTERRFRDACAAARAVWDRSRSEVIELLAGHAGLYQNIYKPDVIRNEWALRIDALLEQERPGLFERLEHLATSKIRAQTKKSAIPPSHPFFDRTEALLAAQQELLDALCACKLDLEKRLVAYARAELGRRKDDLSVSSYDDLLHRLRAALISESGGELVARLRDRYRAALIDEFQDTDPVQYDIFRRVFAHGAEGTGLFLIGDPKQAIYAFRGADVFAYLDAARTAVDEAHTLSQSWRSDPGLLRALNAVFGRPARPFLVPEIHFHPVSPCPTARDRLGGALEGSAPFELLLLRGDDPRVDAAKNGAVKQAWANERLPRLVASEIVRLLSSGGTIEGRPIEPGDVAVLCRTNAQAHDVQGALRELGVPAVLEGDRSVFEQEDAMWLERVLEAMANPRDASLVRAALATPILGVTGDALDGLNRDEGVWEGWLARFDRYHRTFRDAGFVQAFRQLVDAERVMQRLLARPDGERRLTNVLHLAELLHDAATRGHLGPQALVRWLEEMRRDQSARGALATEAAQIRLESDARAVRLTTIHRSKGLEYPIVYCPFLWDGNLLRSDDAKHVRFHDAGDGRRVKLDLGSGEHGLHAEEAALESLAENLRLLYVALTRAKHRCSVVWGLFDYNKSHHPALGYVLHGGGDASLGSAPNPMRGMRDEQMRAQLAALVEASEGTIAVRDLCLDDVAPFIARDEAPAALTNRALERAIDRLWRISSFSGLVSRAESEAESWEAVVGCDHPGEDEVIAEDGGADIVLHDFPAGPKPGLLLHEIYEHLDFAGATEDAVREQASRLVARYGYEARFVEPLCRSVRDVLDTPLDQDGVRLCEVPLDARLNEVEFTFPVRATITPERLAEVFLEHGAPDADPGYARRLARLGFDAMRGQLRGFIDLVFVHDGRYYVVDYKSNHLGATAAQYAPDKLRGAMAEHHYYLQYFLYTAALHRHLRTRLPSYDFDRHMGGVRYLFLRGMSPDHPPGSGVFRDRPSRALIEDLCALLDPEPT